MAVVGFDNFKNIKYFFKHKKTLQNGGLVIPLKGIDQLI
jgi:hypothetical protein